MKIAFVIVIIAAGVIRVDSMQTKQVPICSKLNAVENYLRKLESNGIPFSKIPQDRLLSIKSLIKAGEKAGCEKQSSISTPKSCKRFFQKGQSVICQ